MAWLLFHFHCAAQLQTNGWNVDVSLNLFMAGVTGDVTARGVPAHIDASFGDVLEHLKAGAAGRVTLGYDRWFASTEFSYMKLEASVPAADLDLKQWLVEPSVGYRFCQYAEIFAGARYNEVSGDVNFKGPLGVVGTGMQEWWDPIIGTILSVPLIRGRLTFDGHFDIGGFGVSSDITWQAFPYLNWHFTKWGSVQAGYRWLGTKYDTGSGTSKFRYDVIVHGPQIGFTLSF
jgi:hypothetical protein